MIARIVLAVAALAAALWIGASLRSAQLQSEATSELRAAYLPGARGVPAAQAGRTKRRHQHRAADLFERSRHWAPYQVSVDNEAALLASLGRRRRAVELLDVLVRREPDNPQAWAVLGQVTRRTDPARSRAALRRSRELSPPVARR